MRDIRQVIAIDPGNTQSAVLMWNGESVLKSTILPNHEVLSLLREEKHSQTILAIEMVESFGMAVGKEVFETVYWIGRFVQLWDPYRYDRIGRKEIKLHLCQSVRAKDANIRQALIDRFGIVGTKKNRGKLYGVKSHLWSALAVAVTFWDTHHVENHYQAAGACADSQGN